MRGSIAVLCLTTALSAPSLAAGRGVGGAVGGAIGGVSGGGSGGGISSGGISTGVSVGGITVGRTGRSSDGTHFTGSNFFSSGVDFVNGAARSSNGNLNSGGQRAIWEIVKGSNGTAKSVRTKSDRAVACTGRDSVKVQRTVKKVAPEFATRSRTINVGGDKGVTAKNQSRSDRADQRAGDRRRLNAVQSGRRCRDQDRQRLGQPDRHHHRQASERARREGRSTPGSGVASTDVGVLNANGTKVSNTSSDNGLASTNAGVANLNSPTGNAGSGNQLAATNAGVLNRNSPTGRPVPATTSRLPTAAC